MFEIYILYHRYIIIKKGTKQTHEVLTRYIPDISDTAVSYRSGLHIHVIHHVYTMYIPLIYLHCSDIPVIFNVYSMYILYILYSVNTMYIPCIYMIYTVYILSTYNVYYQHILDIYIEYVVNIHSLSLVYYAYILHQVADVEKGGRVPFHQLHLL